MNIDSDNKTLQLIAQARTNMTRQKKELMRRAHLLHTLSNYPMPIHEGVWKHECDVKLEEGELYLIRTIEYKLLTYTYDEEVFFAERTETGWKLLYYIHGVSVQEEYRYREAEANENVESTTFHVEIFV